MSVKAYSYLRFSTAQQFVGDSYRRQHSMALAYAAEHNLMLDEVLTFRDPGISAFRSRNARSGALRAFLDGVETGLIESGSVLLVESLDRISRDQILAAQWIFLQIVQSGVDIVTLIDGRRYSQQGINDNPFELIFSLVTMMRANEESATKSRRIKETWAQRRTLACAKPMTATCPGWLRLNKQTGVFEIVAHQALIIQRIFSDFLAGVGCTTIAKRLNAEGWPNLKARRTSRCWRAQIVTRILKSPQVIGTLTPTTVIEKDGESRRVTFEPILNYYPAIIDRETFEAVQREKAARRPEPAVYHSTVRNIVARLARCSTCGSTMSAKNGNTKAFPRKYLACERQGYWGECQAPFVRYEDVAGALVLRSDEIRETRSIFVGQDKRDESRTKTFFDGFTAIEDDPRVDLNPLLANAYATFQRLSRQRGGGALMINKALHRCFSAIIVDREANRLLFVWRDGVGGALTDVWKTAPRRIYTGVVRAQRAKRQVQADAETMHRLYGLIDGKRDGRFPLLTLAQVDEVLQRRASGETIKSLAESFGVSQATIARRVPAKRRTYKPIAERPDRVRRDPIAS